MKRKPLFKHTLFLSSIFLFVLCACRQNNLDLSTVATTPAPSAIK